ncbi:ISL3 family transposase [Xanthomonas cucurbitae]|uniref:ISL3 family transposase n=1 Tax=Xanthomonas cucurbitae TaxID=56453 RepID=UPI002368738A|nr:ISL3 family transposase [Xanthomonas cucurbitae]WDM84469.1 ISL3 family transposase [Xanthomonas cucurbitae]
MCSHCGHRCRSRYDKRLCRARDLRAAGWMLFVEFERWRVDCPGCGGVHVERLDWLDKNPCYTKRLALHVGNLCRSMMHKAVAELERLDDGTVKELSKLYMAEQVRRAGTPAPRAIGIDEIAIHKGHDYRVVVSDLERGRPIWFGGSGRTEADIDQFFAKLGPKRSAGIDVAVMDMWRPFRNSVGKNAPNASIVFDKFHIMRHLSDALDQVRRDEYKRLQGQDRSYIKGQRYTLLSNRENLTLDGRRALTKLLAANKRLNTAYLLKESFRQLWSYRTERSARDFFERWEQSLRWQRLAPYQKFVRVIERHWNGIAAYCHPDHNVSLGLVEGLNNKIRVIQRSAYGYHDEDFLKLKIIASLLPPLPENARFHPQ